MKKAVVLLMMLAAACVFCQIKKGPETVVIKNKIDAGLDFGYTFNSADIPVSTTGFSIPNLRYTLETAQEETNKFFLFGDLRYDMSKTIYDGEAHEGEDGFGSTLYLHIDPQFRFYVTKEMLSKFGGGEEDKKATGKKGKKDSWEEDWVDTEEEQKAVDDKNRWFFAFGLPLTYESITPQNENIDGYSHSVVDFTLNVGYDKKTVDIKKLSPWAKFQDGYFVYGLFEYRLTESYDDESPEKLPMFFGAAGDYAYDLEKWIPNAVARGFMSIKYQLATEAVRVFPWEYTKGYQGSYLDLSFGVEYAQDFNDKLNFVASISGTTWQLGDDPESDSINSMKLDTRVNYYSIPELNVFAGFGFEVHLKEKDKVPDYKLTLGASYNFDFIEMKNRPKAEKKSEEEEDYEW